ncbi:hypothetical protein BDA99DRAFT_513101 [Phascolomyces articulosus]|uniref:Very long-chain fatty acid transport protein n=1 Tax=Phascolomyces articulosus TaxID=60185 RepID=A0AAD5JYX1_9FUNG|nr:hypothetical protein BDA99DRAFT_513101 [Phascolomyces articulosus]
MILGAGAVAAAVLGGYYLEDKLALRSDLMQYRSVKNAMTSLQKAVQEDKVNMYYRFRDHAKATPDRVFLIFEGRSYTFRQLELASNRLAHFLLEQNVKPKDVVCMMEQNHPTFFIAFWGIMKIGAVPALINTNLSEDPLFHCLSIAESPLFLFDPMYEAQVATISDAAQEKGMKLFAYGESTEFDNATASALGPALTPSFLSRYSDQDTDESLIRGIVVGELGMLMYTSGSTGLPKAAIVQHSKIASAGWAGVINTAMTKDDITYCCLPLYHATALFMATHITLAAGAKLVIARKFSASRFWDDVYNNNCTIFFYVGEVCRYLLNRDPHPLERKHKLHTCYGNGMPPELWNKFRDRFGLKFIAEFYGATEGAGGVFNYNRGPKTAGAVGHQGPIVRRFLRPELKIVKIDPLTEEPLRNKKGFCIECNYNEPGELMVELDPPGGRRRFDGYYKNNQATDKKVITDVFKKGDRYFRSGDLLKMNSKGLFYFVDRLGDTFRWHGENVATTEVSQVIAKYPPVAEANVYGVKVPSHDGRAGMVALILHPNKTLDFDDFYKYLSKNLPRYAIPLFVRFVPSMDLTGSLKVQKVAFRNQGIDKIPEDEKPLYWVKNRTYVPFTDDDYARISTGKHKL